MPHFAHIPCRGPNGTFVPTCRAGGESEQHIKAKHKLVEWQGRYRFALKTCEVCRGKTMEDCRSGTMQIEARSVDKKWRYDVLYTRDDGTKLALEVYHKHATGEEKIRSSALAGIPVAEFDADSVLSLQLLYGVLDNKCDTSWICSQKCTRLKEMREAEAKKIAQQQEQARLRLLAEQREEARRQAQLQEQARLRFLEQQREEAKRQEEARLLAQEQELKRANHIPKMLFGFACVCTSNPVNPDLFHALGAVSVEGIKVLRRDYIFVKTSMANSSVSIESVLATLNSFGVRPVRLSENEPEIFAVGTCTHLQRQKFFKHIKINRLLYQSGSKTTYWHWKPQQQPVTLGDF